MDGYSIFYAFIAAFLFFFYTLNICGNFMSEKGTFITCGIVSGVAAIYMLVGTEDMQYIGLGVMTAIGLVFGLINWIKGWVNK